MLPNPATEAASVNGMNGHLSNQEMIDLSKEYTFFEWSAQQAIKPLAITRAKGVYMWDADGKRYLDFNSQLMNVNIGHGDERVINAIHEQAQKLCYVSPYIATEPRAELGRMLAELSPGGQLRKCFFTLGGADANENAIRIARMVTGRHKIVARYRSYHGGTAGALTLTGDPRRWASEPGIPGVVRILDPYQYRSSLGRNGEDFAQACLDHIEEILMYEGPQTVAAIIMETVTGTNGIIIPPDGYMQGVRRLCDKYGIILITDEVMAGFGRTGKWFAIDHWGVVPDILTCAKGLTSGYLPLGAVMVNDKIARFFDQQVLYGGLTYNSHALCCAAAIATINVYKEDHLIERAAHMGQTLGRELEALKAKHPSVGDVRYIGLFSIIELVKNRATREPMAPFNANASQMVVMNQIGAYLREHGLFTFIRWNNIFANPPLVITEEQLNEGLSIIDEALKIADEAVTA